jgi:hypothetical protein
MTEGLPPEVSGAKRTTWLDSGKSALWLIDGCQPVLIVESAWGRYGNMSLHDSPLLADKTIQSSPCREWLSFTKNANDYFRLAITLSSVPLSWLEWTERIVRRRGKRKTVIDPLGYRMTILWNGIILLQETKFICDIMENALRQAILRHCHKHSILLEHVHRTIPDWEKTIKKIKRQEGTDISPSEPMSDKFLFNLTFYQTTEIISRNWSKIDGAGPRTGFNDLFWRNQECRDRKLFEHDMRIIRNARNQIAHSKSLFQSHETQKVCSIAWKWLSPVDIGIGPRIQRYRRDRPGFLTGILMESDRFLENPYGKPTFGK